MRYINSTKTHNKRGKNRINPVLFFFYVPLNKIIIFKGGTNMTPEQIKALFDRFGYDNLIFVSMNNNRRIHVDNELRNKLEWDHDNELLIFDQDDYVLHEMRDFAPRKVTVTQDYSMLEALIFARDERSRTF